MHKCIPVTIYNLTQDYESLFKFLKSIKFEDEDMLFFSKTCYEFIKKNSKIISETVMPVSSKNFYNYVKGENLQENFSLIPMYSGEWYYLEVFSCGSTYYCNSHNLPKSVKLIMFESEFVNKDVSVQIIPSSSEESPVDFILKDHQKFKNSFIILTKKPILNLSRSTSLVSHYKGILRLSWQCDDDYPGGMITLKTFVHHYHYLLENMEFPFFCKPFSMIGLPDSIVFII